MNINASLVPKSYSGYNTWEVVDLIDRSWPKWNTMFDFVTSPSYSFSNMVGFKESNKDSFNLEIELPRFRKENIKLSAENNVLHISAEQDNLKFYHSVSIPATLDTNTIEAKLDHGVLSISAQKSEQSKIKFIEIKS
jgi:HSP20 family molecular chaperone IbpA